MNHRVVLEGDASNCRASRSIADYSIMWIDQRHQESAIYILLEIAKLVLEVDLPKEFSDTG